MKRSLSTILLFAALVGLLLLLGALQFRWQRQISASEAEKMQRRVHEATTRFASDFNREMQGAYFNFQTDALSWRDRDWSEFNERLAYWRSKTQYPTLVAGFVYFDAESEDAEPLVHSGADGARFEQAAWNDELRTLRSRIGAGDTFTPVLADISTLVLPISEAPPKIERIFIRRTRGDEASPPLPRPKTVGYLAIRLDKSTITGRLLPDLTDRHFGDGEFAISVDDGAGRSEYRSVPVDAAAGDGDARARLFDLSAENFILFSNRDVLSSIGGGDKRPGTVVFDSRLETHSFSQIEKRVAKTGQVTVEMKQNGPARASMIATRTRTGEPPPWTLTARHRDGSVAASVAKTEWRNLGVGFGILALLGAAVAGIIVSSARARLFAQRQVDFVSSVSHEFRTPLAVIYSAGENLADGVAKDGSQVARYGRLIKGEGKKLSAMVEQILEFAGANSGRQKYNFRPVDIASLVARAVDDSRPLLESEGFAVETDIPPALPSVSADEAALNRAIQNLIANSVKYANGQRWIRVSAANGGGTVKIVVEDRGIGISSADLKHVFEPFYRSRTVVDAQIHGSGLGLSLVKQIAEAHGGRVTAESGSGRGSRFTIELPVVNGEG
ncbi:MAG: sensor histidine kinase [Pyrinomonadaceae bacterium]